MAGWLSRLGGRREWSVDWQGHRIVVTNTWRFVQLLPPVLHTAATLAVDGQIRDGSDHAADGSDAAPARVQDTLRGAIVLPTRSAPVRAELRPRGLVRVGCAIYVDDVPIGGDLA